MALTDNILAYWNLNNNGSGGVSLLDSTSNGNNLIVNGSPDPSLGSGIIAGDAVGNGSGYYRTTNSLDFSGDFSINYWTAIPNGVVDNVQQFSGATFGGFNLNLSFNRLYAGIANVGYIALYNFSPTFDSWYMISCTRSGAEIKIYLNGSEVGTGSNSSNFTAIFGLFACSDGGYVGFSSEVQLDEIGAWNRALTPTEINDLYNEGSGNTYPFYSGLYYNNAQADGDWANLLNWWQDPNFTIQATSLPTSSTPVNLYNQVTQNTQGSNQCFCSNATFWSADFAYGLTLQSSGVVNMQGNSAMAGHSTDGVSMHDSSQLTSTSVIDGNVTMRDSSRAFGYIGGNAYVYYDGGNAQYPIGGTVAGTVSYIGWPAASPQYFNDQVSGSGNYGTVDDLNNWWADDTFTTRPINSVGSQVLPDPSTVCYVYGTGFQYASRSGYNFSVTSIDAYGYGSINLASDFDITVSEALTMHDNTSFQADG